MFDISSIRSDQDFDGFMVLSNGELMTVAILTDDGGLIECEICSTLSSRVYVVVGGEANASVQQCQACLHEAIQTADISGDQWFAPLS